jgi:hypothetical protein
MRICRLCGKCCENTEMQLSKEDIEQIETYNSLNLKQKDFCIEENKILHLQNRDGRCIFFDFKQKSCLIYEIRPTGCKFYPMIFDVEKNICILDEDCPYRSEFYKHRPIFQKNCKELRKWISQRLLVD